MADMEKALADIEVLKESRIRHDEQIKANRETTEKAMRLISKLDGEINEKFDMLIREMREGFEKTHQRIDDVEGKKHEKEGYDRGMKETRAAMLKQFGIWVSIAALGLSFIIWWLTK